MTRLLDWAERRMGTNLWTAGFAAFLLMFWDTEPIYDSWYTWAGLIMQWPIMILMGAVYMRECVRMLHR